MALREGKFKPDLPIGSGVSISNIHDRKIGLKFTETEVLFLSEKGEVIGILDRKHFSTGADDDVQEVDSVKVPKAKKATGSKSKKPTTKKAGAK